MRKLLIIIFSLPIFIFGQKTFTISLPPDISADTIKKRSEVIKSIFLSDNLIITAGSVGCFHSYTEEYVLIKKNILYDVIYKVKNNQANGVPQKMKKYKITNEQFNSIRDLCLHGLRIGRGFCTTSIFFTLGDGKSMTCFNDDRCDRDDDIMQKLAQIVGVTYQD